MQQQIAVIRLTNRASRVPPKRVLHQGAVTLLPADARMERRKSDRVPKSGESAVSCSEDLSPDEKSGAGAKSPLMDVKIPALDKYNLRIKSIQNRIALEKKKKTPVKKEPKAKQRPVPLSKYRRRTANARERTRMQVTHHNS